MDNRTEPDTPEPHLLSLVYMAELMAEEGIGTVVGVIEIEVDRESDNVANSGGVICEESVLLPEGDDF